MLEHIAVSREASLFSSQRSESKILPSVATGLQFWPSSQGCAGLLRLENALLYPSEVALPVQSPLVKSACCERNKRRHAQCSNAEELNNAS